VTYDDQPDCDGSGAHPCPGDHPYPCGANPYCDDVPCPGCAACEPNDDGNER